MEAPIAFTAGDATARERATANLKHDRIERANRFVGRVGFRVSLPTWPRMPPFKTRCISWRTLPAGMGSTSEINDSLFDRFSGVWVTPGSPYKNLEKTLWAIRFARENGIPCFGTCGGFQHMVLEYARNVLGYEDAQHAEYDPYASSLFISALACSLAGRTMELHFDRDRGSRTSTEA